jgi:hypothetical protein
LIPGFSKIDKENQIETFFKYFFYSCYSIFCILKPKKCGFSNIYIFEIIPLLWHSELGYPAFLGIENIILGPRAGVGNLRPAGRIQPAKHFYQARKEFIIQ